MSRALLTLVAVAMLAGMAACTRVKAKTAPDPPEIALDVPLPPPRQVEPAAEAPAAAPAEPEPAKNTPPAPRPRPAPPREQPRPEPPRVEPPADVPRPVEEAPRGPTTLQTAPPEAEGEVERTVRATLARATSELNGIDYRRLNNDARVQYDTAKRFIRQADDALRAKNVVFARSLADKAATIAAQLKAR